MAIGDFPVAMVAPDVQKKTTKRKAREGKKMTDHEYRERRRKQKLEKLFADVNLAIMVKRGEDTFDEGTPEQQQERADELIMEGKRFVAKMFFAGDVDHQQIINELEGDHRLVGDVSLFEFSEYAQIMARVYHLQHKVNQGIGLIAGAQREYDEIQANFAVAQAKLAEAKIQKSKADDEFEKVKAEREAEIKRLGLAGVPGSYVDARSDDKGKGDEN